MLPGSQQQAPWHWHLCWTAVPEQAYADMQCDAFDCTLCAVPAKAYTPITIKFQDCMSTVITACLVERHVYDQGMLQCKMCVLGRLVLGGCSMEEIPMLYE